MARAFEKTNLHSRVALRTLLFFKTPRKILGSVMLLTWLLSAWMQNTAVASLMTPLLMSILNPLKQHAIDSKSQQNELQNRQLHNNTDNDNDNNNDENADDNDDNDQENLEKDFQDSLQLHERFATACLLGVAYCASLGGATTPIGTGPNLVFFAVYPVLFPAAPSLSFGTWMLFVTPLSFAIIAALYAYLALVHCRGVGRLKLPLHTIQRRYAALGRVSTSEKRVALLFVVQLLLWLTRGGGEQFGGWSSLLGDGTAKDGTVAMLIAIVLLILPSGESNTEQMNDVDNDNDEALLSRLDQQDEESTTSSSSTSSSPSLTPSSSSSITNNTSSSSATTGLLSNKPTRQSYFFYYFNFIFLQK